MLSDSFTIENETIPLFDKKSSFFWDTAPKNNDNLNERAIQSAHWTRVSATSIARPHGRCAAGRY